MVEKPSSYSKVGKGRITVPKNQRYKISTDEQIWEYLNPGEYIMHQDYFCDNDEDIKTTVEKSMIRSELYFYTEEYADPIAGNPTANATLTEAFMIKSLYGKVVADANVATRRLGIKIVRSTSTYYFHIDIDITASQTVYSSGSLPEFILKAGDTVKVYLENGQVGDQISDCKLMMEACK
jgi:hypothetical protein